MATGIKVTYLGKVDPFELVKAKTVWLFDARREGSSDNNKFIGE